MLADRLLLRWLVGASLCWLLFDFVYYGNTISSPAIDKLVAPHASLVGATTVTLAIFAVAALPARDVASFVRVMPVHLSRRDVDAVAAYVAHVAEARSAHSRR